MTTSSPMPAVIITISILVISVVPLLFYFLASMRNARRWDEIFTPLGFTGRMFMINGRHYTRNSGARAVNIYIFKGSVLDIQLAVPVNAQLRIFRRDFIPPQMIVGMRHTQPALSQVPGLDDLAFYPANTTWLGDFLEGVRAAKSIRVLMKEGAEWAAYRQVVLTPGTLNFHLYETPGNTPGEIDQDTVNRWVSSLEAMADELQEANLPHFEIQSQSAKPSPLQQLDSRVLVLIMAAFFGIPVCFFLIFLLLMLE